MHADCCAVQLPSWVSYFQALAVPLLAVVVAAFGVWISRRQERIARDKFVNDEFYRLFEKRFAIYQATREFLAAVFLEDIYEKTIRAYGLTTLDAQFLFDESVHNYLREIAARVRTWHMAKSKSENATGEEFDEWRRIKEENMNWLIAQGDEATGFAVRFRPFLVPSSIKR
jgi:hypothetical protein